MGMLLRRYHNRKDVAAENPAVTLDFTEQAIETPVEAMDKAVYTRTDISRMNKEELVALALANRIENADMLTGMELKHMLVEKLGL